MHHLVQDYLAMPKESQDNTIIITPANDDRNVVNKLIRQGLQAEGGYRGITLEKIPDDYRFMSAYHHHYENKTFPALVVAARNSKGELQALQAICLDDKTANKAAIEINKITHGRLRFGAMVAVGNEGNSDKLCLAEGPETALSILNAEPDSKVMASLSISNFHQAAAFVESQTQLILCADNDNGKDLSLEKLSSTLVKLGEHFQEIKVAMPNKLGQDFNDVHKEQGIDAVRKNLSEFTIEQTKAQDSFIKEFSTKKASSKIEDFFLKNDRSNQVVFNSEVTSMKPEHNRELDF